MSDSPALLAALALCGAGVALFLFRASPRATVAVWVLVLFFAPIWVGVNVGFFWAAITLVTLAALAASPADLRLTAVDGLVAAFALLVLVLLALRLASLSASVIALLQWIVPYAWGRIVLARVPALYLCRVIAAVATCAAGLALIEFATGVNPFVLIPGPGPVEEWASLQPRASFVRAEGAFGHSIALGASLAMSSAFVLAARWRTPVMLLSLAALIGATVVTFSRIGLITAGIAVALGVLLLPELSRAARWTTAAAVAAAVAVVVPFVGGVLVDAGDEAGGSAQYRAGLLSLASEVRLLGGAGDWQGRMLDGVYLGSFARSVDSTLLLIALRFGLLPTALVLGALLVIAAGVLRRPTNPAAIAVASQLPALLAVALITQYGVLLWFFAGVAVAWSAADRAKGGQRDASGLTEPAAMHPEQGGARPSAARTT